MTVLVEGDLQITLPNGATGRKFDDEKTHGLSHCMKAVDLIIELEDRILFVELKDPEHPASQPKDSQEFVNKFLAGQIDADLKTKYRDSFLYEWSCRRADKPIYYLVLIAISALGPAELLTRTEALKRQLPLMGPQAKPWLQPFVAGCVVMNLDEWNRLLPELPVSRVAA